MRASRLVAAVLLLQTRGRMTAQRLANELDVSVRTVYRDMDALAAAGIPLYADAGHDGGYQLVDGYRTQLTGMTGPEAEALAFVGLPGAAKDLGLDALLATAQLKLKAALPGDVRDRTEYAQQRFHLDTSTWYADADPDDHVAVLVDAACRQRRVRARYRRWKSPRETTRVLDPYGLVLKAGRWYLVAGSRRSTRTYRVAEIRDLVVLDAHFERPARFDLAAHWSDALRAFDEERFTGTATIRLTAAAYERLPHLVEPALARAAAATMRPELPGWVRVDLPLETVEHTAGVLLRLGAEAEVLTPPALREHLRAVVSALHDTYRGAGGD